MPEKPVDRAHFFGGRRMVHKLPMWADKTLWLYIRLVWQSGKARIGYCQENVDVFW